ncbi:TonB-dependent receptor [Gloeocapsopsis sp. IPPAS B-1203]|uniref:TonB-dependent receptor domain-containing protein n=1 Tax=Gloeocapsopsis sp. IPPAS B-1203 TaxID=2049454 RepID=UPI000C19BA6E|nr:TonB-dependent receptor [Gloeocapsopsis sp. IPPAS B-1203]PIG90918.1 TonB-dependent siderophore receptor [Gloeocapsopsis sp. IPPAS B-1203]
MNPLNSILIATGVAIALIQPARADIVQVTGIQLNPTDAGVEIVIETADNTTPQTFTSRDNQTLFIDISNAQFRLPQGNQFRQENPIVGISTIEIISLEPNSVRISIVGETALPTAQVNAIERGLVVSVTPDPTTQAITPELPTAEPAIEITVTATRTEENVTDVPRSVTVINREQLEQQRRVTRDLGEILGKLVPGLAPPTQSASNFGQSLRGRNVLVLIDGIPQSTSRNVQRDFRTIDPSAIERIEVLRGPTAIYGDGASGGVINIITRTATEQRLVSTSELGISNSLTRFEDSVGYNLQHSISGTEGDFDYLVSAAFGGNGGFFDAQGDRIPPDPNAQGGIADTETINILGKVGTNFGEQRLQLSFNHFNDRQDTNFTSDPNVNTLPEREKARALGGLVLDENQATENTLINLDYRNDNFLGSQLRGQLYYRNYLTRFFPFDARDFASFGNEIIQSRVESEKLGGRLQVESPLFNEGAARLLWGLDYFHEDTAQPVSIYDGATFDASGGLVFAKVGDRSWTPPLQLSSLGLFAQLNWDISARLLVNGGIRHERAGVDIDDFTTLAGNDITGGNLDFNATLFNLGAVFFATQEISLFTNFSQGFSLADIGRVLRNAPLGFSVEQLSPEPQRVNNYEIGIRGQWEAVQASLSAFYNQSDLGTTFDADLNVIRAPERVYGIEAAVDTQLSTNWLLGGTLGWVEGEIDLVDSGEYTDLDGFRIPPLKLSAYVQNQTTPSWSNRLQLLFSGSRNPAGDGFGFNEVENYLTVDYISSIQIGTGTLNIGVENLFNAQYFPVVSQVQGINSSYAAARGTTLSIKYAVDW